MKVIVIDPTSKTGEPVEYTISSLTIVEGMYVKELGLTPLAYVYKAECRVQVMDALEHLRKKRRALEEVEAETWYRILPQYRADKP